MRQRISPLIVVLFFFVVTIGLNGSARAQSAGKENISSPESAALVFSKRVPPVDKEDNLMLLGKTTANDFMLLSPPYTHSQTGVFVTKLDFGEPDPAPAWPVVETEEDTRPEALPADSAPAPSFPEPIPSPTESAEMTSSAEAEAVSAPENELPASGLSDGVSSGVPLNEPRATASGEQQNIALYVLISIAIILLVAFVWWVFQSKPTRHCRQCARKNNAQATYCASCGAFLGDQPLTRQNRVGWLLGLGFLAAAAASIFLWIRPDLAHLPELPTTQTEAASLTPATPESLIAAEATSRPAVLPTSTHAATLTPTATQTQLPTATATVTPSPTDTPVPVIVFQPLELGSSANGSLDFSAPQGEVQFNGIPFNIGDKVFKSQASPAPHNVAPERIVVYASLPEPQRLHLLLNTGNGFNRFNGQIVAQVIASCKGTPYVVRDLRLGEDVREWHSAANVVSTAGNSVQVWPENGSNSTSVGHIDLLSLDLPVECQQSQLDRVEILDTSAATTGSLDPALNLVGITVEYNKAGSLVGKTHEPGDRIALVDNAGRVYLYDPFGGNAQLLSLTSSQEPYNVHLKWNPAGTSLAIFRRDPNTAEIISFVEGYSGIIDIGDWVGFSWDEGARGITYVTHGGERWAIDLAKNLHAYAGRFDPFEGGAQLANFVPSPNMAFAGLNFGGGLRGVPTLPGSLQLSSDMTTYRGYDELRFGNYSWSPDSRFLAGDVMGLPCYAGDIYILDTQTGKVSVLLRESDVVDRYPLWGPDSQHLAIASSLLGDENSCAYGPIWIVDMENQQREQLTNVAAVPTAWSPDGKYLLITKKDNENLILDIESRELRPFPTGYDPQWRP